MDVEVTDINGGNAEAVRNDTDEPKVAATSVESQQKVMESIKDEVTKDQENKNKEQTSVNPPAKMDEEVNGDVKGNVGGNKKSVTPMARRKLRKFKANSTSTVEVSNSNADVNKTNNNTNKNQKRKLSEPDGIGSDFDDSIDFFGFDINSATTFEPSSVNLQKLIAEAEANDSTLTPFKRMRRSLSKGPRRNIEFKTVDDHSGILDANEMKMRLDDAVDPLDIAKFKKETNKSDIETDGDHLKTEDNARSPSNRSPMSGTNRQRGVRARGVSPASAIKQKATDVTSAIFREPFKYGWKREVVYRGEVENPHKRTVEIFYYTPKGKKIRSMKEIGEFLNTKELTVDNFTFIKEPTGINDSEYEIVSEESTVNTTVAASTPGKKMGSVGKRGGVTRRMVGKLSTSPPAKGLGKFASAKTSTPSTFKTKVTGKRGPQKKDVSPPKETDVLTWSNSTSVTRRSHVNSEKSISPYKTKRSVKTKLQEPCSIRCSRSMGLIPSLQCCVCLCLYHPECVGHQEGSTNEDYICKNCSQDSEETKKSSVALTPPPLIPISMISSQNTKSRYSNVNTIDRVSSTSPSRISKSSRLSNENPTTSDIVAKNPVKILPNSSSSSSSSPFGVSNPLSRKLSNPVPWFARAGREYMPGQDRSEPKPAQNIAVLAGKRYIVVPKNNAGAVQPAITAKTDKIPNQSAFIEDMNASIIKNAQNIDKTDKNTILQLPSTPLQPEIDEISSETNKEIENTEIIGKSEDLNLDKQKSDPGSTEIFEKTLDQDKDKNRDKEKNLIAQKDEKELKKCAPSTTEHTQHESCIDTLEKIHEAAMVFDADKTMINDDLSIDQDQQGADESDKLTRKSAEQAQSKEVQNNIERNDNIDEEKNTDISTNINQSIIENRKSETTTGAVTSVEVMKKTTPVAIEVDQRQYFMSTVCAGYNALSRVFQYLKVQELLRAARVCKMWRDLAAHPALWKTVRMKNSQVTDWDGLVASLQRHGTQHLDLRKMLIAGESDSTWKKFVSVIPNVSTLTKLELCRCPVMVVEEVIKACPRLEVLSANAIKCEWLHLDAVGNLTRCQELRLKAISGMSLNGDLTPLQNLVQLTHLSLTSVKELGKKKIEVLASLINLETLELGECSDFPAKFGTAVLCKLTKLERLRLEKGQGTCCTFDILNGVAKLEKLQTLELVNFDVKNGFDKRLANCKNIKRLLIIPTYISQSATSNNMVLGGVTELSNSLTHFVWGVTLELLRVTELFVDQCNQINKQVSGDSIPVLKPVPCLKLIEIAEENEAPKVDEKTVNAPTPEVDILPLPQLQKLLLTALPKTRVKILKIPFHATWRQNISDTSSQ